MWLDDDVRALARGERVEDPGRALAARAELEARRLWAAVGMPRAQARAVWALADAHYHEWAAVPGALEALEARGPDAVRALVEAGERGAVPGLAAPMVDGRGAVRHETGSGRLVWEVRRSGEVRLEVRRPGGVPVLVAHVRHGLADVRELGPYAERHAYALRGALEVLGASWTPAPWPDDLVSLLGPRPSPAEVRAARARYIAGAREAYPPLGVGA